MITDIIAGIISGTLGAMGFGGGGILILYLTLYKNTNQLSAQGINLMFFIPTAAIALYKHIKNKLIDWKISLIFIVSGLIGIIIGYYILQYVNENIIRKIFALLLIIVGIKDLVFKNKK